MVDEITSNAALPASRQEPARQAVAARETDGQNAAPEQARGRDRVTISNEARDAFVEDRRQVEARAETSRDEATSFDERRSEIAARRRTDETANRRNDQARASDANADARRTEEPPDRDREYTERTRA